VVTLVIEGTGGSQLTYQLEKQAVSIGASSRNDVVLRAPGVAPQHVVIQRNGSVYTFLGQHRQVVVLNGERRSRGVLKIGDKIRIGTATIVFKGGDEDETEVEVVDGTEGVEVSDPAPSAVPANGEKRRSEIVLFREPHRLSDARQQLVEIFRSRMRSDLVPSLRARLD
jgi:pSer/pThr/pTyr-binding forkhead associated (FHA) protein